jgi:hypothetical protein
VKEVLPVERLKSILNSPQAVANFLYQVANYQCSEEMLKKIRLTFSSRPLLNYFLEMAKKLKHMPRITEMERMTNLYLGLPEDLKWPRNKKGHLRHPKSWTRKFLRKHYSEEYLQPLSFLRKLVFVEYEVVIDIPKHAFFFIKAAQVPFSLVQIEKAYACAELLKRLCQYDRFRLLTITTPRMAVGLDKIDKAIFWPELGRKRWIFG